MSRDRALLAAATIACLTPFVCKAFHVDDAFFLAIARQIRESPTDFFGFTINWYGTVSPVSEVMKNPPLASYYLAAASLPFGWGEVALHMAFWIPAIAVVLGTHAVASELTNRPMLAALVTLLSPGFLVSATNVMSDVPMLALWIWAVHFWIRAQRADDPRLFAVAGGLIALAFLSKYFAISLLPLMVVWSLASDRRVRGWWVAVGVVAIVVVGFEWAGYALYDRGLFLSATRYVGENQETLTGWGLASLRYGLAFAGGSFIVVLFASPALWRWTTVLAGLIVAAVVAATAGSSRVGGGPVDLSYVLHVTAFCAAALGIGALAGCDLRGRRDPGSLLLALWVAGVFLFSVGLNWTVSVRNLLPMAPAVGILLARRVEEVRLDRPGLLGIASALVASGAVALGVAQGDQALAGLNRDASVALATQFGNHPSKVWFQGHWGFQHYMERLDFTALDMGRGGAVTGDVILVPSYNTNTEDPPRRRHALVEELRFQPRALVSSMGGEASFYSSMLGSVPYLLFSPPAPQRVAVWAVR